MDVLGDGVLKFIACRVTVDGDIPDDSPVEAFRSSHLHIACILRILPNGKVRYSELGMLFSHALSCLCIRGILREAEGLEQLALQMNGFVRYSTNDCVNST